MTAPRPRRLDIWDALILAVATAVGFALPVRLTTEAYVYTGEPPSVGELVILNGIDAVRPFLMVWPPACLILRLRRPRPPSRRLARQPGMAACGIATLVLVGLCVGHGLAWPVAASPVKELWMMLRSIVANAYYAEAAIAGAWLIMALGGWWRPERSAIDRIGRALGAAWVALMVLGFVAGSLG
jgi:hypothetical protein